ncbi:hypothetical protein BH10PAT4_BH10PAT4_2380 [soil metagenome]
MLNRTQKGNALLIVIIVIVALILIGALGFVFWRQTTASNNTASTSTTTTNTAVETPSPKLIMYCTTGEKLCFHYLETWKIEQLDPVSTETGFTGDHLSVSDPTGSLKMTITSGIGGLGGTCEPDGTTTYVLDGTPIPLMTGFKTDYAQSTDIAHVARVVTQEEGKFRSNLYLTNNGTYSNKAEITDVKGICFSQFLNGRNAVLSSDYAGSGSISVNSGGSFSASTDYTLYDTLSEAKAAFGAKLFTEATNILTSLHYK